MVLGTVTTNGTSCRLCGNKLVHTQNPEETLREHLRLVHHRIMVSREEKKYGNTRWIQFEGPRWAEDMAR
jgi:hypothetical protein